MTMEVTACIQAADSTRLKMQREMRQNRLLNSGGFAIPQPPLRLARVQVSSYKRCTYV